MKKISRRFMLGGALSAIAVCLAPKPRAEPDYITNDVYFINADAFYVVSGTEVRTFEFTEISDPENWGPWHG